MVYEYLLKLIKKHFYIVFNERYKNESSDHYIERYIAKHALLKPELIVVNDQPFGFKSVNKRLQSLEKFPIYVEMEYAEHDGHKFIESFDLYAEAQVKSRGRLTDVIVLANQFENIVNLDRIKRLNNPQKEFLIIGSKLGDILAEGLLDQDLEEELISETELTVMLETHLLGFVNFIKVLDDVLIKGKSIQNSRLSQFLSSDTNLDIE